MGILKKIGGFLCVGIAAFAVSSVSAETREAVVKYSEPDENGNIAVTVGLNSIAPYLGDVDNNGVIELRDADLARKIYVGGLSPTDINILPDDYEKRAEVDGESGITMDDAGMILWEALLLKDQIDSQVTEIDSEIAKVSYMWLTKEQSEKLNKLYAEYEVLVNQYVTAYSERYAACVNMSSSGLSDSEFEILSSKCDNEDDEDLVVKVASKKTEIDEFLKTIKYTTTTDLKFTLNIGTEKIDEGHFYVLLTDKDGNVTGSSQIVDLSKYDWNAYLAKLEASKNVKEETVENPKTVVAISVIGLAIIAIAGTVVAKKKNLFNRV